MDPSLGPNPDLLILTLPAGSSLSRWSRFGVIEREIPFIKGLARVIPRILFVSVDGEHDASIAKELDEDIRDQARPDGSASPSITGPVAGSRIDAIAERVPDADLGENRTLEERVLARVGMAKNVVIQTIQLDDGGLAHRLPSPLRRVGLNAALVARGSFIDSRVLSSTLGPHHYKTLSLGAAEQQICSLAQIVVGTSTTMIDELCWKNGIDTARARVVAQHVATNLITAPRADNLVVTSGRFNGACQPFRGAIDSVGALSPAHRGRVELHLLGEGPDGHDLPAYADSQGVNLTIRRGLTHAELQGALCTATIYIQTEGSRRQSHTVLEAMAAGCPVVVTDLPEYNGLIENGTTGIRVTPEARGFAFAIDCLLSDPSFSGMLGESAQARITSKCGVERAIDRMLACYADALRAAPQRGSRIEKRAS